LSRHTRLQILVGLVEDGAARGLVDAAALHAHQPVLHDVQQADAVFAAQLVELVDNLLGAHLLAVDGRGHALFKLQLHIGGLVRRVQGETPISRKPGFSYWGSLPGSSRSRPSWERCHRFLSLE
jgi:hypothetical protein